MPPLPEKQAVQAKRLVSLHQKPQQDASEIWSSANCAQQGAAGGSVLDHTSGEGRRSAVIGQLSLSRERDHRRPRQATRDQNQVVGEMVGETGPRKAKTAEIRGFSADYWWS